MRSVLSEVKPRPDRGFGRGVCYGILYLALFGIILVIREML